MRRSGTGSMGGAVVARRRALGAWGLALALACAGGCSEKRAIPARGDAPGPERYLTGGKKVITEDFERDTLGPRWTTAHDGWRIVDGWLHSQTPENAGAWLNERLPQGNVRIEWTARSEPMPGGQPFPGDLKVEAFAQTPTHEAGYVFINGGWTNQYDVIAKLGEHTNDGARVDARKVLPSKPYRYAVVRLDDGVHFFRDGELLYSFVDPDALAGGHFGFNNWRTNAFYDDLAIFAL